MTFGDKVNDASCPLILAPWQIEAARNLRDRTPYPARYSEHRERDEMQVWVPVEPQPRGQWELDGHTIVVEPRTALGGHTQIPCPYGQPGDLLHQPFCETCEDSGCPFPKDRAAGCAVHHCPDCLSRQLRLTRIRVARLGEMTEQDAREAGTNYREEPWDEDLVCWVLHLEVT